MLIQLAHKEGGNHKAIRQVRYSDDGSRLLSVSEDDGVRVWDSVSGDEISAPIRKGHVLCADFSREKFGGDYWIATSSTSDSDKNEASAFAPTVRVWNAETGLPVSPPMPHPDWVQWVAFSPDGQQVVTASDDHDARICDVPTGRIIAHLKGHTAAVSRAFFNPGQSPSAGGRWAPMDGTARLWEAGTGKEKHKFTHGAVVTNVAFSPDGARLVTTSQDGSAQVWDTTSHEPVGLPLQHAMGVVQASLTQTANEW